MRKTIWEYFIVFILVFVLCSELIWQITPLFGGTSSFSLSVSKVDQKFIVDYSLHANTMLDVKILLIPAIEEPVFDLPIHIFYDLSYPAIHTSWTNVQMLYTSLEGVLHLRGFKGTLDLVSAKELEDLMSYKEKTVIIMASGSFPANVFSKDIDLVTPWLDSGGILLWFGWFPGFFTVYKGQVENATFAILPQQPREEGVNRLGLGGYVEMGPFNGTLETAEDSSYLSNLLEINYNLIQDGLLTDCLSQGGLILGKTGGNPAKSSVSVIPVGMGKMVVFGFFVLGSYVLNGPELSAMDVAQILDSGILYASKTLMPVYEEHQLSAGQSLNDRTELEVNSEIKGLIVYIYSTITSNSFLFHSEFISNT
jgi:hypothetical protein